MLLHMPYPLLSGSPKSPNVARRLPHPECVLDAPPKCYQRAGNFALFGGIIAPQLILMRLHIIMHNDIII